MAFHMSQYWLLFFTLILSCQLNRTSMWLVGSCDFLFLPVSATCKAKTTILRNSLQFVS